MNDGDIGPEQALLHLLDVLPTGSELTIRQEMSGALERTRRQLVDRLNGEMNRLVAEVCAEVAANCGITARKFFFFAHPDCPDRLCRGSRIELLRLDRAVGGDLSCLGRVVTRTRLRPLSLGAFRLIPLSGQMEIGSGRLEMGKAIEVGEGEELLLMPGATFLVPHPIGAYLIRDAVRSGFRLQPPGRVVNRHLRVISTPTVQPANEPEGCENPPNLS